jgi:hypothetical protein
MTTETVLFAKIRARCNLNANDGRLTDAELRYFLNDAIQHCGTREDWPWHRASASFNTVVDQAAYSLGALGRVHRSITIPTLEKVLEEITNRRAMEWASAASGVPSDYVLEYNTITLYPTPSQVWSLTHHYYTFPSATTTGTDVVDSPDMFDHLITTKASIYVAEKIRDSELAQRLDATFREDMKEAKVMATNSRASIGINVRDDWIL